MKIEDIVAQNPWWNTKDWQANDRHLRKLMEYEYVYSRKDYLPLKKGVIITYGPRQIGKTTWIKQKIADISNDKPTDVFYLDAEMIKDRFDLADTLKTVEKLYSPIYIFIDEINAVEEWERTIKTLVDESFFERKHVILTGSNLLNIMKKSERLPGRMADGQYKFRYYPLSFREVAAVYGVKPKNTKEAINQLERLNWVLYRYFIHGGYIRAINTFHKKEILSEDIFSIYSAWIDGGLAKVKRSSETANQIINGITDAMTNDVSWSSLAKGINHVTVGEYMELLKDMFVVNYLEKARQSGSGAPKNKKIYFTDPFIYWLALFKSRKIFSVKTTDLDNTTMGKLAELSAYTAIIDYLDKKTKENDFDIRRYANFEKERNGEIDFVVKLSEKSFKIECKFGRIDKEKKEVIYLTKDIFSENKLPLAVFLMFPEESLQLLKL